MTTEKPQPEILETPARRNPVPMIVAAVVAVAIVAGLVTWLVAGSGDDNGEATADDGDAPGVVIDPDGQPDPTGSVEGDEPAPDVTFEYFDQTTGSLDDFDGQPMVVNFFASWCGPCRAEMPEFEQVFQSFDGDVAFLGFNTQDRREDGLAVAEETGVTYTLARDPDGSIYDAFEGIGTMPMTVFVDADGEVVKTWNGPLDGEELTQIIEQSLL